MIWNVDYQGRWSNLCGQVILNFEFYKFDQILESQSFVLLLCFLFVIKGSGYVYQKFVADGRVVKINRLIFINYNLGDLKFIDV